MNSLIILASFNWFDFWFFWSLLKPFVVVNFVSMNIYFLPNPPLLALYCCKMLWKLHCFICSVIRRFLAIALFRCNLAKRTLEHNNIWLVCSKFNIHEIMCCFGHRTCTDPSVSLRIFVRRHLCAAASQHFTNSIHIIICMHLMRRVRIRTCECLIWVWAYTCVCASNCKRIHNLKKKRRNEKKMCA